MTAAPAVMTTAEVAALCRVSPALVRAWSRHKKIKRIAQDRYSAASVRQFVEGASK